MTGSDVRGDVLQRLDAAAARRWAVVTRAAFAARRARDRRPQRLPRPRRRHRHQPLPHLRRRPRRRRVEYEDRARRGQPPDDAGPRDARPTSGPRPAPRGPRQLRGHPQPARPRASPTRPSADRRRGHRRAAAWPRALRRADDLARASVAHPVEGTILTSRQAAAAAATEAAQEHGADLYASRRPRSRPPEPPWPRRPPSCRRWPGPGVVDAGGAGYVLLLESLERVVTGDIGAESVRRGGRPRLRRRAADGPRR